MTKWIMWASVAGTLACSSALAADSKARVACSALDEKDAVQLLGGPLGEVFKNEVLPSPENGRDHNTVCGFFPNGYKIQSADGPPERGVQLQLHAMTNEAAAQAFYDNAFQSRKDMANMPGSPLAGSKISTLTGIGKAAFLVERDPSSARGASYKLATLGLLKGNVMAQIQVWKNDGSAGEIARNAGRKVAARLP